MQIFATIDSICSLALSLMHPIFICSKNCPLFLSKENSIVISLLPYISVASRYYENLEPNMYPVSLPPKKIS